METSSEEIRRVHAEIKGFLPPAAFVIIEHVFRNYESGDTEAWNCQVYANDEQPLDSMLMVHRCEIVGELIERVKEEYKRYQANRPSVDAKIAELEMKIAKLRGEQI